MIRVELSRPADWEALGARWRVLEHPFGASFFQSWTWIGCMAETRFPHPVLLEAFDGARTVGLALFNRRRGGLHLSETGDAVLDGLTVEHNGILAAPEQSAAVLAACLAAARKAARRVVMSGIGEADRRAAITTGPARLLRSSLAPHVDLAALRASGQTVLDSLSANTRYQIGRSRRRYEQDGPLVATRAHEPETAHAFLHALIELHTVRWGVRGKPGAFASPVIRDFHRQLVDRGLGRGEVDLWRITAGSCVVGYLYNFRLQNSVLSYQSGFAEERADHRKPGLICHSLVMELHRTEGLRLYDFLAGDHRYKNSFATGRTELYWMSLPRGNSTEWITSRIKNSLKHLKYAASDVHQRRCSVEGLYTGPKN